MSDATNDTPRYWSSVAEYNAPEMAGSAEFDELATAEDSVLDPVSRRKFLAVTSAGAALAGTAGCVRKPVEYLIPYSKRPEDLIPGKAVYYATTFTAGTKVLGVLAESQDGRPIKIEGNPQHPNSRGRAGTWAQASILNIYDPERSTVPSLVLATSGGSGHGEGDHSGGHGDAGKQGYVWTDVDLDRAWRAVDHAMNASRAKKGAGLGFILPTVTSPALAAWLGAFAKAMPRARMFRVDTTYPANTRAGAGLVAGRNTHTSLNLAKAKVIVSIDADFLGREGDTERHASDWAAGRRVKKQTDPMNRVYSVEPHFTLTGAMADHRLRLRGRDTGSALKQIANLLFTKLGVALPPGAGNAASSLGNEVFGQPKIAKFLETVAKDMAAHPGAAVVVVGERQPAWVHALGHFINEALGANRSIVTWHQEDPTSAFGTAQQLAEALNGGQLDTVVSLDANPVLNAPGALDMGKLFSKATTAIHFGMYFDETAQASNVHLPLTHWLEQWGDAKSEDGTISLQQPLIAPLMHAPSPLEVVARLTNGQAQDGRALLMSHWRKSDGDKEWASWLHTGVVGVQTKPSGGRRWSALAGLLARIEPQIAEGKFEVNFHWDSKVLDGRWANNAWLVELPDPMSKLSWDNAGYISPATAEMLEVTDGDVIEIEVAGRALRIPAMVAPGQADATVSLNFGWGREIGSVATGAGVNVYPLQDPAGRYFLPDATVRKVGGHVPLANIQKYGSLTPPGGGWSRRPIIRRADRMTVDGKDGWVKYDPPKGGSETDAEAKAKVAEPKDGKPAAAVAAKAAAAAVLNEEFVLTDELMAANRIKSLSDNPLDAVKRGEPNPHNKSCTEDYFKEYGPKGACEPPQQWGMTIDLNTCIGCEACMVACIAENNISVVGKDRVIKGREMHWIRMDRYYEGDPNDPMVSLMPMTCQQCENAPCETVCPVAATVHSPEGLNDMAYNRCIGTRYCANNCPYKVRRFNYFNYNLDIHPLAQMQKNPDVTLRFRGVMEKCTYCVQRINEAKIDAKVNGNRRVPDIDDARAQSMPAISACQQACPTDSIVLGDVSDPNSRVSRLKAEPRDYKVLGYLNTKPRTSYLAKIRNPNPDLV